MKLEESVDISCSPSEAWEIVGNYANDSLWRGEVIQATSQPTGKVVVGADVVELARFMGVTLTTPGTVAEVSGRSFRWQTKSGLQFTGRRRVDMVAPDKTRVTLLMEGRFAGPLVPLRVLEPVIQATMRQQVKSNLVRLRTLIEGQRGGQPTNEMQAP